MFCQFCETIAHRSLSKIVNTTVKINRLSNRSHHCCVVLLNLSIIFTNELVKSSSKGFWTGLKMSVNIMDWQLTPPPPQDVFLRFTLKCDSTMRIILMLAKKEKLYFLISTMRQIVPVLVKKEKSRIVPVLDKIDLNKNCTSVVKEIKIKNCTSVG